MLKKWWKDLSVSKKLYAVVGVMALLIATELLTLVFAMDVLSSVRTFVGGEGLWSKAQKNAIHNFQRYVLTQDERYWEQYLRDLQVPTGDHNARVALETRPPDEAAAVLGFTQGGLHPDDIPRLIKFIKRFYWVSYVARAMNVWREADTVLVELRTAADNLHTAFVHRVPSAQEIDSAMREIERLNSLLTDKEVEFSDVLGQGSRWLESVLIALLIMAVLTVESTGLFLTISISRSLNRSLREIMHSTQESARGNFTVKVPVRSGDELGRLAAAVNQMNDELARSLGARREAETASESKTMFLANMSHEIRTPLGVIFGLVEMLKEPNLSRGEQLRYIETIERTGKNLNRIINDILDVSRVESGHLEIENSRFALNEFLADLETMLNVAVEKSGNRFQLERPSQAFQVVTDRTRLRQILINLVNNALKFTHVGEVTLTVNVRGEELIFTVRDTGIGISEENRRTLFQEFSRGADPAGRHLEGSGLGLVLSKRLAQALGGDVLLLDSVVGRGTTFQVNIKPQEIAQVSAKVRASSLPPTPLKTPRASLNGRKVLVVEDSEDNQMLVRLILSRQGIRADFANNGREGVEQALHERYDAILMDMQMPVLDGYSATKELREHGYRQPIIALTAHAMKGDRDQCLRAGCDDYLTKPLDSGHLYETLARHMEA
jgi:signal transduction histidine kinase/CheY-like chemotaxis protein